MTFGDGCSSLTFRDNCYSMTFGDNCDSLTFGDECYSMTFGDRCDSLTFGDRCYSLTFGDKCYSLTFGDRCYSMTFGKECNNLMLPDNSTYGTLNILGSITGGGSGMDLADNDHTLFKTWLGAGNASNTIEIMADIVTGKQIGRAHV